MELDQQQNKILAAIDAAAAEIISVSHQIHDHPELGREEFFASKLLADTIEAHGFKVERGVAGIPTAFRARKGSPEGPRVAFLAEYDALPEIGHGCGHNVIASSALAAAIGLGSVIDSLSGEVLLIGTPAEETFGAKVEMTEKGVFDEVDAAMMVHPYHDNFTAAETLAIDGYRVEFFGVASHAASAPWEGKNALDGLILLFNNLNALRQHIRPDARIHGIIKSGGAAPNIIPEYADGRFYVRAGKRAYLSELVEKFKACAEAAAIATGTRVEVSSYETNFDDIQSNLTLAQRMAHYMAGALGSRPFKLTPTTLGSTDMGNVSHRVPGIHPMVEITDGKNISTHTHEFCLAAATPYADQAILRSGKGLALTGCDFLSNPAFRKAVREEFVQELGHPPAGTQR